MDPLTTLLAAAAATGPNTLQSQALTALRSAGPQESFFTRMGNPHPLQMQQLAQPTTPHNPIIAQPTSAPTALPQQLPTPILPLASPLADPAPTALHIPTLQAIHRMQQPSTCYDANDAADSDHTTTGRAAKPPMQRSTRRPIFLHSPQGSWPFWHSWRRRTSKHCAAAHTTGAGRGSTVPGRDRGPAGSAGLGAADRQGPRIHESRGRGKILNLLTKLTH